MRLLSRYHLLLLACCAMLQACEQTLDLPLRKEDNLLTLNAEWLPEEPLNTLVTFSKKPFQSGTYEVPEDAVVQVYEDEVWTETLSYKPPDSTQPFGIYSGISRPKAGSRYRVEVSVPGYQTISTEDRIPLHCPIQEFNMLFYPTNYGQEGARFSFVIPDDLTEDNYYQLFVYYLTVVKDDQDPDAQPLTEVFSRRCSINIPDFEIDYSKGILFTDQTFAGRNFPLQIELEAEPISFFLDDRFLEVKLIFELRNISRNNYLYRSSYTKFRNDQNNGFNEPVFVWNNIQGGLGIFSAFTRDMKEIRLK